MMRGFQAPRRLTAYLRDTIDKLLEHNPDWVWVAENEEMHPSSGNPHIHFVIGLRDFVVGRRNDDYVAGCAAKQELLARGDEGLENPASLHAAINFDSADVGDLLPTSRVVERLQLLDEAELVGLLKQAERSKQENAQFNRRFVRNEIPTDREH